VKLPQHVGYAFDISPSAEYLTCARPAPETREGARNACSPRSSRRIGELLNQPEDITRLQEAIRSLHGCEAKYSRTVLVREVFQGDVTWDGFVRVFALINCPTAKNCFAWSHREGKEIKTVAVLEIPPVDSPEHAVKMAIAAKAREQ
jgi:hypothetical protein